MEIIAWNIHDKYEKYFDDDRWMGMTMEIE